MSDDSDFKFGLNVFAFLGPEIFEWNTVTNVSFSVGLSKWKIFD